MPIHLPDYTPQRTPSLTTVRTFQREGDARRSIVEQLDRALKALEVAGRDTATQMRSRLLKWAQPSYRDGIRTSGAQIRAARRALTAAKKTLEEQAKTAERLVAIMKKKRKNAAL